MRPFILLLSCTFFMVSSVSVVQAQEEETPAQATADTKKEMKAYLTAEKKWLAKQVDYGKKICKILSKVKSAGDGDKAAKKIDTVHLTASGKPKSPRPKMPESITEADLPLKNIELDEDTAVRSHLPKKLLVKYNEIMNEMDLLMSEMEEPSQKLQTALNTYMKNSYPFFE